MPIHFQKTVKNELKKLIETGHLEKANNTTENCFVSPAVITIKKDKSVKIALDLRKLNEVCVKRKATMPNMEELISKISAEITRIDGEIWMSKIDLDYAYGQAKLPAEAARHCVFSIIGGDFTGHYRFKKGFYGLSYIATVFHFDPKKENYVTTDACNTGLGATLWQKEGEIFRPVAFASRFLTDCERKYAINELELLGALWGLEYFRYFVYGKKVNLLTDHQALQPLLKRNRAHKQYSARLTRWLDRLSHFDVNVQYTAGKNIPLTDYLSRHPIVNTDESAAENNLSGQNEAESEEEFVINQVHGLFDFIQTNGSIKLFTERTKPRQNIEQSQHGMCKREQNRQTHLLKTSIPLNGVNQITSVNFSNRLAKPSNMDKVNGIDMHFIFKKRGHSPDTLKLWTREKDY